MKKIVLIGDSIREGYDKYIKMAFEGIAEVYYPTENCRFSGFVLRHLTDWKIKMGCGDDVDLVHWNAGLWDDLVLLDGKPHTSLETYKENVGRICDLIKILFPKAKMIFATSTPVREELFLGLHKRYNRDTKAYNAAAVEVIQSKGGEVNDLFSLMENCPSDYYSDMTHFYTGRGTQVLTEQVLSVIENALNIQGKHLNFEELFSAKENITGM